MSNVSPIIHILHVDKKNNNIQKWLIAPTLTKSIIVEQASVANKPRDLGCFVSECAACDLNLPSMSPMKILITNSIKTDKILVLMRLLLVSWKVESESESEQLITEHPYDYI